MKFIVELRLKPGTKGSVTDAFRAWSPKHNDYAVRFRGARAGTRSNVIFVVGESDDERLVANACQPWNEYGNYQIYPLGDG